MNISETQQNNRKRVRIGLNSKVRISCDKEISDTMKIDNISHNGIALKGNFNAPDGAECTIELMLPGEETTVLKICGTVVRNFDDNLAIKFSAIEHDSFGHLHSLIMYNADDPQAVEVEFDYPGFKKDLKESSF